MKVLRTYNNIGQEAMRQTLLGTWWYKYDERGNLIYQRFRPTGFYTYETVYRYKYDDNNRVIYKTDGYGEERWKYDERGNLVFHKLVPSGYKEKPGFTEMWEYDENNRLIFHSLSGNKTWLTYDQNGELLYKKVYDRVHKTTTLTVHDKDITYSINPIKSVNKDKLKDFNNINDMKIQKRIHRRMQKRKEKNKTYEKTKSGLEKWWEYDDHGNMIHYKTSKGFEKWITYDDQGFWLSIKNTNGYEHVREWDEENKYFRTVFCTDESKVRV